jgi:hypothetical protein
LKADSFKLALECATKALDLHKYYPEALEYEIVSLKKLNIEKQQILKSNLF